MPPKPINNNQEIDQALKDFESKSNEGQAAPVNHIQGTITPQNTQAPIKQVEGVSFDTDTAVDSYKAIKLYNETKTPKMVKLVMKASGGGVKNQKTAEWLLLGFVAAAIGISLYLIFGKNLSQKKFSSAEIEQMKQTQMQEISANK